jgi:hypothetical protein
MGNRLSKKALETEQQKKRAIARREHYQSKLLGCQQEEAIRSTEYCASQQLELECQLYDDPAIARVKPGNNAVT